MENFQYKNIASFIMPSWPRFEPLMAALWEGSIDYFGCDYLNFEEKNHTYGTFTKLWQSWNVPLCRVPCFHASRECVEALNRYCGSSLS